MNADLLSRLNVEIITPEAWTQDGEYFSCTWGVDPLATCLSVQARPKGEFYVRVYIGPFKGLADAEVFDELPRALRAAYVQAMRSARGTEHEPQMFKDVLRAPKWLGDGLRRALDGEVAEAAVEVRRLKYAMGQAEYQHEKAVASRALLPEEPKS